MEQNMSNISIKEGAMKPTSLTRFFSVFILFFALVFNFIARADNTKPVREEITEGREFWFGVPLCWLDPNGEGLRGDGPICIWLSSKVNTRGYIEDLESGSRRSFLIQANKITQVVFGDVLMHKVADVEQVKNKGIYIKAEDPISVAVYISYAWTGEAFRVIPINWLGKKYVTTNLYLDKVGTNHLRPGQIVIVATEDNTIIQYKPTAPTFNLEAGQISEKIRLNKGQTYFILGRLDESVGLQDNRSDLTGTYIEATKPIAVISGHTKGAFPRYQFTFLGRNGSFMRNMMIEMIWPIEMLGTKYVSCPVKYNDRPRGKIADDRGDMIRFVAAYDNTIIYQMRKDGSGLKQISLPLKRGQFHEITNQEDPAYYESNKPVLVAQYGKTWWISPVSPKVGDYDEPQNPSRNGQGMMLILTPLNQWTSYATFRSPMNIDNFVAVTFRAKDLPYLYFDGKKFTQVFGNSINYIEGTEFAYVTEQVGAGDHYIKGDTLPGGKEKATFAGYVYGNWDRSKDGFAYGYPLGINYNVECTDSLVVNDKIECGDITGEGIALPPNADCAGINDVFSEKDKTENYTDVELNPDFRSGDKKATFTARIIDKKKPGKITIVVQTRSGLTIRKNYEYQPELIEANPTFLNFGQMQIDEQKKLTFTVTNVGEVPVTIQELKLKFNRKEFSLASNQLPVTLQPQESKEFEVIATAYELSAIPVRDSVIAVLTCYEETIVGLELRTGEPIIFVEDAHWDPQPVGKEVPKIVEIRSTGSIPVTITSYDFEDKVHFRVDESTLPMPLTIQPNSSHFFTVYYKGDVAGVVHSTRCNFVCNATKVKPYSDWDGSALDAGPTITGYDWKRKRVIDKFAGTDKYEGEIILNAIGNAKVDVMQVRIDNDPDGVFSFDAKSIPTQLKPDEPIPIKVWFAPKAEKEYTSEIVLVGKFSDKTSEVRGTLHGIGILPHIDITGYDFPPILVNSQIKGNAVASHVTIDPLTAMELTIFKFRIEGPDKDAFEIPDEYLNPSKPFLLNIGEQLDIPVTFKPTRAGSHVAYIVPESDAPDDVRGKLTGSAYLEGIMATDYDYGRIYITTSKDGKVFVTNLGTTEVTITSSIRQNVKGDFNEFKIEKLFLNNTEIQDEPPFTLKPNDTLWVYAKFTPQEVKTYDMQIAYDFTTTSGEQGTVYSRLTGEGMVYKLIARIPKGKYQASPGEQRVIEVLLEKHPEETKDLADAKINDFKVRVKFKSEGRQNVQDVYPDVNSCNDLLLNGTLSQGWNCEYATIVDNNSTLQIHLSSADKYLNGFGTLLQFRLNTFLSDLDIIPLPVEFQVLNQPAANYVLVDNYPGDIFINPVCVNNLRLVEIASNQYFISGSYPNPINTYGVITYGVAFEGPTTITLWNSMGDKVATFVSGNHKPGVYELTVDVNQLGLPSGIYYCKFQSGSFTSGISFSINK